MKETSDVDLAPSILAADFTRVGDRVAEAGRTDAVEFTSTSRIVIFVPIVSMGV